MDQVQDIKDKIDIVEFINARVPLKRAGRNFRANCPFHQEKTPSFFVNSERQIWRCFGACGEGGDIISFLQKYENLEFVEALKILAVEAGVKLKSRGFASEKSKKKDMLYRLNNTVSEYYHYLLTEHKVGKQARNYLKERRIKRKTITSFKLGYAPDSWDGLLRYLKRKKYSPQLIQEAGLAIKARGTNRLYDRFRGRVIFPIMDYRKNIVGFSGRILEKKDRQAKYINTPETLVYRKRETLYGLAQSAAAIRREGAAIITEGEFDAISSFQLGVGNIVAIKGSSLAEEQLRLISRFADKIIFALDADKAGDKAVRNGVMAADEKGLEVKVVPLKGGKDPDEIIRKDPLLWRKLVKKPIIYFDYVIESSIARYGTKSSHAKDEIIKDLAQFFAISKSPIVKAHYARKLATDLDLPEDIVANAIEKEEKKIIISGRKHPRPSESKGKKRAAKRKRWRLLEEHILSILLQSQTIKKHLELLEGIISLDKIPMSAAAKIIRLLREYAGKHEKFNVSDFIKTLDKELIPVADKAYMVDIKNFDGDTRSLSLELRRSGRELQVILLKAKLKKLTDKLKKLERESGKESRINNLNQKIAEVTRKIRVVL